MASRLAALVPAVVMSLVALVVAHNLVFLAGYGAAFGEALAHTGHDHGWSAAVFIVLTGGLGCLIVALWQLRRLTGLARDAAVAGRLSAGSLSRGSIVRRWLRLALRLAFVTAVLFVLQENVEHLSIGKSLPGLGVLLSPEYPNAIAIIAAVALAVALVGALFGWRFELLAARIRAVRARHRAPTRARPRVPLEVDHRPSTLLGPGLAVRAPPLPSTT